MERIYIYVGITDNLERRFNQHQSGRNPTTRPYRPFFHFYTEKLETRVEVRKREKYLKSGIGKEFLKGIL